MQWLQDPSQIKVDNINNIKLEATDISGTNRRNI
jgi:hypothetical protein